MAKTPRPAAKAQTLHRQGTYHPHPEAVTSALFHASNDFFDARDVVQVKYEMVRAVDAEQASVTHTAAAFGFSRPSFYQAQAALARAGLAGLIPQKRGPRGAHKLTPAIVAWVRESRTTDPALRTSQLAPLVEARFGVRVHPRTLERTLTGQKKRR